VECDVSQVYHAYVILPKSDNLIDQFVCRETIRFDVNGPERRLVRMVDTHIETGITCIIQQGGEAS
jgi:hypothetical protein